MEDIKEGKVTLPILIALDATSTRKRSKITKILIEKDFDRKNLDILYNFVLENNAVEEIDLFLDLPEIAENGNQVKVSLRIH